MERLFRCRSGTVEELATRIPPSPQEEDGQQIQQWTRQKWRSLEAPPSRSRQAVGFGWGEGGGCGPATRQGGRGGAEPSLESSWRHEEEGGGCGPAAWHPPSGPRFCGLSKCRNSRRTTNLDPSFAPRGRRTANSPTEVEELTSRRRWAVGFG